jgi:hypothetical protein
MPKPRTKRLPSQKVRPERKQILAADGVTGEARHRRDAIGDVGLADRPKREEIIEGQRAEGPDHAQRRKRDAVRRDVRQRCQDDAGVDALQRPDQDRDRKGDDQQARNDSEPFPADLFLEATPERGQQPMHSSSRRDGNISETRHGDGGRRSNAPCAKTHTAKPGRCAVLDNPSFRLRWPPLSYAVHMLPRCRF